MRTTPHPPTAEALRETAARLGVGEASMWTMALPVGTDLFAVAYQDGQFLYRSERASRADFTDMAEAVAWLTMVADRADDHYLDLAAVARKADLLRIVHDGSRKHVTGLVSLLGGTGPVSADATMEDAVLLAVAEAVAEEPAGFCGMLHVQGRWWLSSPRGRGTVIHPASGEPRRDRQAGFEAWARRVCSAVGGTAVATDAGRGELVIEVTGQQMLMRAEDTEAGFLTAVPDGWTFSTAPHVVLPAGWHLMGVVESTGQVVLQHSATGMCSVLLAD